MEISVEEIKLKVLDYLAEDSLIGAVQYVREFTGSLVTAREFVRKVQNELEPEKYSG